MKLADFDTATPDRPIDEDESSFQDNDGNRTYCNYLLLTVLDYANKLQQALPKQPGSIGTRRRVLCRFQ
jgi:hypothetical protein